MSLENIAISPQVRMGSKGRGTGVTINYVCNISGIYLELDHGTDDS